MNILISPFVISSLLGDSWICSVVKLADGCRRQKTLLFRGTTFNVWRIVLQKMADRYFEEIVLVNSEWCSINVSLVFFSPQTCRSLRIINCQNRSLAECETGTGSRGGKKEHVSVSSLFGGGDTKGLFLFNGSETVTKKVYNFQLTHLLLKQLPS